MGQDAVQEHYTERERMPSDKWRKDNSADKQKTIMA